MEYPVFEALHQAHLLIQLGKNFVSGQNDPIKEIGHRLQLLQRCKEDGSMTSVTTFLRLECQDGTRKEGTQDYHGSGRPHSHQLVFTGRNRDDLKALHLHLQQGLVKGSQLDKKKKSKWPVHKGPSQWNQAQASYNIHHAEEDAAHGVRGFFGPLLEVAKCHQDVQVESSGQDNYAAYVAKYAPKFSDAFHEDMLNDDVDANSIAASVLRRYKPAVPEMVLQLFGQVLHPWHITTASGGKRSFEVPVPDADPVPKEISLYQNCKWRHDDMCLLEFLRKSNDSGRIAGWLQKSYKKFGAPGQSMEAYANNYQTNGEKVVACGMGSRLRDKFYGQWLVLNVPFRRMAAFMEQEALSRVPETDKYMAACIPCNHHNAKVTWTHRNMQNNEMMEEGHTQQHRKNCLDHFYAHSSLLSKYIDGSRQIEDALATSYSNLTASTATKNNLSFLQFWSLVSSLFSHCFSRLAWPHSQKFHKRNKP